MVNPRPHLADPTWQRWLHAIPDLPGRDRFELALVEQKLSPFDVPDLRLLSQFERAMLKRWIDDYSFEFGLTQEEEVQVFEAIDLVNLGTIAVGLAAAPFLVPLTIGAFTMTGCLWAWKISGNAERKERQMLVQRIKRLLRILAEILA